MRRSGLIPLALLLMACTAGILRAAAPPVAAHQRDRRLRPTVGLRVSAGVPLRSVIRELSTAARVPLRCGDLIAGKAVAVSIQRPRSVAALMTALATSSGAAWVRDGEGYLLTRTPELAGWERLDDREEREALAALKEELARSLTPAQVEALKSGREIPLAALSPHQRRICLGIAGSYAAGEGVVPPEAALGASVFLKATDRNGRQFAALYLPEYGSEPASCVEWVLP